MSTNKTKAQLELELKQAERQITKLERRLKKAEEASRPGDGSTLWPPVEELGLEGKNQYRTMVEQLPLVVYINPTHDPSYTIYISPQIKAIFGYSAEEWLADPKLWSKTLYAGDRERVLAETKRIEESGEALNIEYRMVVGENRTVWVHDEIVLVRNAAGEPQFWQGYMIDITARKQVEEALQKSEERFRTTFDYMLEGVQIIDFEWKYLYLNSAAEKHNRRPNLELLGRDYREMWPGIETTHIFAMIKRCMEQRIPCHMEEEFSYPDGTSRWFELSIQAIPDGVFILSVDITERKQAETAFKEQEFWLKASQRVGRIGSYALDIEQGTWESSDVLDEIFGIDHDAQKTVASWVALVHPEEQQKMLDYLTHDVLEMGLPFNKEYRIVRARDQEVRWMWGQGELSMDLEGNPTKMFGMIQDVTERKQAEQELFQGEKRYRVLFENMPIAIWEEDFSQVRKHLISLKEQGTINFRTYFAENPGAVLDCVRMIKILDLNETALKMYAAKSKDDLIKSVVDDLSAQELELMREVLIAVAYGMTSSVLEGKDETLTGELMDVSFSWSIAPGYEHDYSRIIVTTIDITERKRAQEKLEDSRRFFQSALDAASAHICILDESGTITAVNGNWREFGRTNVPALIGEDVGTNYLEVCRATPGESNAEANAIASTIEEILAGSPVELHSIFEYPNHSPLEQRWFVVRLTKFEEHGKPRVVVSHENITQRKLTEQKIERRVVELEALYQSGISFSQTLDERDIGEKVMEVLSGSLNWHHAAVRVRRADTDYVELLASIHPGEEQDGGLRMQSAVSRVGVGLAGWVIEHGKPLRINNLDEDPRYVNTFEGMKSGLYIPMRTYDRTIGCISAESDELEAFTEKDEHLLTTLATQAAIAIQNADLFKGIQNELTRRRQAEEKNLKQLARLTALQEINRAIISTFDLQLSLNTLLSHTLQILRVDAASVLFINTELNTLDFKAGLGFQTPAIETISLKMGESYAGRAAWEQRMVKVQNLADEPQVLFQQDFQKEQFVSYYGAPLIAKGKVIGVLELFHRSLVERNEEWLDYFGTLAELAAIAIDNANLYLMSQHELAERKVAEEALLQSYTGLEWRVKERTADLKQANLNLEQALRIKDEFLASMSHELRTPLNAIIGLSESLAEQVAGPLNEKQQRYINTIGESGHHLLELINDILDLAKIEAGYMDLTINSIQVETLCQSSIRMIRELAQKKSLNVSFQTAGSPATVSGDERKLKQALVNLLGNAVKFTAVGGNIGLNVTTSLQDKTIDFTVWDTGIGIAEAQLPLLFKPFVQLDGGLSREYAGTGLGLALVDKMIQLHGGTVSVESEKDKGSRFTITLPWDPQSAPLSSEKQPQLTEPGTQVKGQNLGTILIVEDTEDIIILLSDYLIHKGYTVLTARNGAEGVSRALAENPDLILMDVMMPIMNGLEATRSIRMEPAIQHIPIIGLTSLAMPGDYENCIAAGMTNYLSKPVELKKLISLINQYLTADSKREQ